MTDAPVTPAQFDALSESTAWVTSHPIDASALLSFLVFVGMMSYSWRRVDGEERWLIVIAVLLLCSPVFSIVQRAAFPGFELPLWASLTVTVAQGLLIVAAGVVAFRVQRRPTVDR